MVLHIRATPEYIQSARPTNMCCLNISDGDGHVAQSVVSAESALSVIIADPSFIIAVKEGIFIQAPCILEVFSDIYAAETTEPTPQPTVVLLRRKTTVCKLMPMGPRDFEPETMATGNQMAVRHGEVAVLFGEGRPEMVLLFKHPQIDNPPGSAVKNHLTALGICIRRDEGRVWMDEEVFQATLAQVGQ